MSTLMNYTFQSFNFRTPSVCALTTISFATLPRKIQPHRVGFLRHQPAAYRSTVRGKDPSEAPLKVARMARNAYHFIASGQAALPVDSMGNPWNGSYVTATGNLKMDLLHNFFWNAVRAPTRCACMKWWTTPQRARDGGLLLVRGGVHIVAYAKALEEVSGVDVSKLLPIPDLSNKAFPEAKKYEDAGLHQILFQFSPNDYGQADKIWKGTHPEDGSELRVVQGAPQGYAPPVLDEEPQLNAPGMDAGVIADMAKKVLNS
jgi:Mn-containing catalase